MSKKGLMISLAILIGIYALGVYQDAEDAKARERKQKEITIPPPPVHFYDNVKVRSYNYDTGGWNYYSDEEIRTLRERQSYNSNGSYIYTPGRHVPSREEEIENYIEDNIDEIMDRYGR